MKKILLVIGFVMVAVPLQAQTGCVNSPEAPTVVLGLAGSVGGIFVVVRNKMRGRKSK